MISGKFNFRFLLTAAQAAIVIICLQNTPFLICMTANSYHALFAHSPPPQRFFIAFAIACNPLWSIATHIRAILSRSDTLPITQAHPLTIAHNPYMDTCNSFLSVSAVIIANAINFCLVMRRIVCPESPVFTNLTSGTNSRLYTTVFTKFREWLENAAFAALLCGRIGVHQKIPFWCHASGRCKRRGGFVLPPLYHI